jgi:metal-responsive CopG/Arc/MetJ family transcriptional regulator
VTAIRLSEELRATVDKWAAKQADTPGRSEAIRRLVELGLTVKRAPRPSAKAAARAAELAANVIDRHIDSKTPTEEREVRKRRLLKGPSVFRDSRKDLAK